MTDGVYRALTQNELNECLSRSTAKGAAMLEKITIKQLSQQDNFTAVILEV